MEDSILFRKPVDGGTLEIWKAIEKAKLSTMPSCGKETKLQVVKKLRDHVTNY